MNSYTKWSKNFFKSFDFRIKRFVKKPRLELRHESYGLTKRDKTIKQTNKRADKQADKQTNTQAKLGKNYNN